MGAKTNSMDLERERGIAIPSAATYCDWIKHEGGNDEKYHIDLIVEPGHVDFTIKMQRAFRVLDEVCMMLYTVSVVQ